MTDLPDLEKRLAGLTLELERTRARRLESQAELRRLSALAKHGDNKAKYAQEAVNKRIEADSTLIVSIERETGHVRRQCDLARGQLETMRTRAAVVPASPEDRLFLVATPHRHHVRHKARNIEVLRARLLPGYNVEGEIFGANDAGEGGVVAAIEPTGPSIMAGLLLAHGKELEAWLAERGIGSDKQTVIVLPGNGREAVQ